MISGILSVYPKFGKETYVESKTKELYRHLPCVTPDGVNIHITITEKMYNRYIEDIMANVWENSKKFLVWGELRSVNEITEGYGLSNLYLRADHMMPDNDENYHSNLFSINSHGTKTSYESDDCNYFWVAANKNILNQEEKKRKPSYGYLKTSKSLKYQDKDIIQGNVKLIEVDGEVRLEALHTVGFTSCRKLVEAFLPKYQKSI